MKNILKRIKSIYVYEYAQGLEYMASIIEQSPEYDFCSSKFYRDMQDATQLYVQCINLTEGALILVARIAASAPKLTNVTFAGVFVGDNLGALGVEITNLLVQSKSITTIDFSSSRLDSGHSITISDTLSKYPLLKELNLNDNNFGAEIIPITANLANSKSLLWLSIADNNLGVHSMEAAANLARSMSLQSINMNCNNIGIHGVTVGTHLSQLPTLEELMLSGNNLNECAADLGKILAKLPVLTGLDISYNDIEEAVGISFTNNIIHSKTLKYLFIIGNHLLKNSAKAIENLYGSRTIKYVDITNNDQLYYGPVDDDISRVKTSQYQKAQEWNDDKQEWLEAIKCLQEVSLIGDTFAKIGLSTEENYTENPYHLINFILY